MPRYAVTYFNPDGQEMLCNIVADDEACAIRVLLDENFEDIAIDSPFAVWRETAPKRKAKRKRGSKAGTKRKRKTVSAPVPTGLTDEDEINIIPAEVAGTTLKELGKKLGVKLQQQELEK